jgi:bla regulator protein BlaR1
MEIGGIINNKELCEYLNECKKQLNIKRNIVLKSVSNFSSPALYGMTGQTLLIPETMLNEKSLWILKYSIYHELAHYKRKDIQINIFVSVLLLFTGLILLYGWLQKNETKSELACDEWHSLHQSTRP